MPSQRADDVVEVPARRLAWLEEELGAWVASGLVDEETAGAIRGRYTPSGRHAAGRVLLWLGGVLLAIGLVLLVAANIDYDALSPLARCTGVAGVWLGLVVGAELIDRAVHEGPPLGSVVRLLAAVAFGATILQVAQSVQVPAYESSLLAAWGVGAVAYAYAVGDRAPLIVGIGALVGWAVWRLGERADDGTGFVLAFALCSLAAVTVAVLHQRLGLRAFAGAWRFTGGVLGLSTLFVVAVPGALARSAAVPRSVLGALVLLLLVAGVGFVVGRRDDRRELVVAAGAMLLAVLLVVWSPGPPQTFGDPVGRGALAHTLVGSAGFLSLVVWLTVVGAARSSPATSNAAAAALLVFVALQSFGLLAPLASGGVLFLVIGGLLVAAGLLLARGRALAREVVA